MGLAAQMDYVRVSLGEVPVASLKVAVASLFPRVPAV